MSQVLDSKKILFTLGFAIDDYDNSKHLDEIYFYVDSRNISAIEGVWQIYGFNMHGQDPAVMRLDYNLENQNTVTFLDEKNTRWKIIVEKKNWPN